MSKRRRKKKNKSNKQRKLPGSVPRSINKVEDPSTIKVFNLRPDKTVSASKEILIDAPIEQCFSIITEQLEQPCHWDSIIYSAQLVSDIRRQAGTISRLAVNLGGKKLFLQAIISNYEPNRNISWVTTGKLKIKENWHLEMKEESTLVRISFARELNSWILGRLIYKATRWKRVEEDMSKTLNQLKETAENAGHK